MERRIVRHSSRLSGVHEGALDQGFHVGQRVRTLDGHIGRVVMITESWAPGNNAYQVILDNGQGGGTFLASQLRPIPEDYGGRHQQPAYLPAGVTAAYITEDQARQAFREQQAELEHEASLDYPEMGEILRERPDPGRQITVIGHFKRDEERDREDPESHNHGWCHVCKEHHESEEEAEEHDQVSTDWRGGAYKSLPNRMYRGLALKLPTGLHEHVHDPDTPPAERASMLNDHIRHYWHPLGMHWTPTQSQAEHYADVGSYHYKGGTYSKIDPSITHVVIHAAKPKLRDIEKDPYALAEQGVIGHEYHEDSEIPMQGGAPVHVRGVSWKRDGDEAYTHHQFRGVHEHTAATYADGFDPREDGYNGAPEVGGVYWSAPAQQAFVDQELGQPLDPMEEMGLEPPPLPPPEEEDEEGLGATASQANWVFYHGTPDERTWEHGSNRGIHIGTEEAAHQALNARIGRPLEGRWDGTREYGKTLLSPYQRTGNERDLAEPRYPSGKATYSTDSSGHAAPVPLDARPNVFPVRIKGPMINHPATPVEDDYANARLRGQITRGNARRGYFYRNIGEDEGSISAAVPSAGHLERLDQHTATTINGQPIDSHGDAPEHGTEPRAGDPEDYDDRSTEQQGDPKWSDPVSVSEKKEFNGAQIGMYPGGVTNGGGQGPGLNIGAFTAFHVNPQVVHTARVPWTPAQRTELHSWQAAPTATEGDFVPSGNFTNKHPEYVPGPDPETEFAEAVGPRAFVQMTAAAQVRYRIKLKVRRGYEVPDWHRPEHETLESAQAEMTKLRQWDPDRTALPEAVIHEVKTAGMAEVTPAGDDLGEDEDLAGGDTDQLPPEDAEDVSGHQTHSPAADEVFAQLSEDFPPEALDWVFDVEWDGPLAVPLEQVDFSDQDSWQAAQEPEKVEKFRAKIEKKESKGKHPKPAILIAKPSSDLLFVADGHHRALAEQQLEAEGEGDREEPGLWAWVATVPQDEGPWDELAADQLPEGLGSETAAEPGSPEDITAGGLPGEDPALMEPGGPEVPAVITGLPPMSQGGTPSSERRAKELALMNGGAPPGEEDEGAAPFGDEEEEEGAPPGDQEEEGGEEEDEFPPKKALRMFIEAAGDPAFRFEFTAAWRDVVAKATRINSENGVRITAAYGSMVIGEVKGDHATYESGLQYYPGRPYSIMAYSCGCPWATFHQDADYPGKYNGRLCSHAYALSLASRESGMVRKMLFPEEGIAGWPEQVVVKSEPPWHPSDKSWARQWQAPMTKRPILSSLNSLISDTLIRQVGCEAWSPVVTIPGQRANPAVTAARVLLQAGEDPGAVTILMRCAGLSAQAAARPPLSWDQIGERHPGLYGDPEVHGEAAEGADGEGIGWAANHLANDRPSDPDGENTGVWDMHFHEESVYPHHIDYARTENDDPRVQQAYRGYLNHPERVPPLVLVHRHGVYQVADGHHRAQGAERANKKVRAYVAYSEHDDEPFSSHDGEPPARAPFHGARPSPGVAAHRNYFKTARILDSQGSLGIARPVQDWFVGARQDRFGRLLIMGDQANAPWGAQNVSEIPPAKPYGATSPPEKDRDPGSYGPLSGPDPDNWGEIADNSAIQMPITNEAHRTDPLILEQPDVGDWAGEGQTLAYQEREASWRVRAEVQEEPAPGSEWGESFPYADRAGAAGPSTSITPRDPAGIRLEEARASAWAAFTASLRRTARPEGDPSDEEHPAQLVDLSGAVGDAQDVPHAYTEKGDHTCSQCGLSPSAVVHGRYKGQHELAERSASLGEPQLDGALAELKDEPEGALDPEGLTGAGDGTIGGGNAPSQLTANPALLSAWAAARDTDDEEDEPYDPFDLDSLLEAMSTSRQTYRHSEPVAPYPVHPGRQKKVFAESSHDPWGNRRRATYEDAKAYNLARTLPDYTDTSSTTDSGRAQHPRQETQNPGLGSWDDPYSPNDPSIMTVGNQQWSGNEIDSGDLSFRPDVQEHLPEQAADQDIVAQFHMTGAAQQYKTDGAVAVGDSDIAAAARAFLASQDLPSPPLANPARPGHAQPNLTNNIDSSLRKQADVLPPEEADELIREGRGTRARNLDLLDLAGTHYVDDDRLDDHEDDVCYA